MRKFPTLRRLPFLDDARRAALESAGVSPDSALGLIVGTARPAMGGNSSSRVRARPDAAAEARLAVSQPTFTITNPWQPAPTMVPPPRTKGEPKRRWFNWKAVLM